MSQTPFTLPDLSAQLIAITGAGFDIGRALSLKCAEAGATVVLIDKDARALDHLYDEIKQANWPEPLIAEINLGKLDGETAQLIASQLYEQFGQLDALIHAAEWAFPLTPLALYEDGTWQKAMQHLHTAPWLLTKYLIPVLSHAKQARVIFTTHANGLQAKAYYGPYGAASAALSNTCDIWNNELNNKGLIFSTLSHAPVKTQIRKKHFPAEDQSHLLAADDAKVLAPYFTALTAS